MGAIGLWSNHDFDDIQPIPCLDVRLEMQVAPYLHASAIARSDFEVKDARWNGLIRFFAGANAHCQNEEYH